MGKSADAFRTISEVSDLLETPTHVLRFWESKFTQVKPVKRAGGRRYYRPGDVALLGGIRHLLHDDGMTIRSVQQLLREEGVHHVSAFFEATQSDTDDAPQAADTAEDVGASASVTPFPSAPPITPEEPDAQPSLFDAGGEEAPIALDVEPEPEPMRPVHSLQITPAAQRAKPVLPDSTPDSTPAPTPESEAPFDARAVAMNVSRAALGARLAKIDKSRLSAADLRDLRMLALRAKALRTRLSQTLQPTPDSAPDTGV
ncbi:MerR family transcriptional regulator [uncultured Thioclava sp.]|uniref:MerR family transcriptional regulator n=1 Tax=uncultured Thioclava sp. TaxID=473858 RepID=UPI0025E11512|nr:MerR family transcriptional regulator [uncultured Thioclava sp.]